MSGGVQITVSFTPALSEVLSGIRGDTTKALAAGMSNLLLDLESGAVKEAPVATGNLADSITSYVADGGLSGVIKATAPYAEFVHEGTGLFGPHKKRITPTTKKALFWPGARHPVRSTKGMKGTPFFNMAIEDVDAAASFEEGVTNYLKRSGGN